MKVKVKLINGEEKEIEVKETISWVKRNEILDKATEYIQDEKGMRVVVKSGVLMNEILKAVVSGVDVNLISVEDGDKIVSKFDQYFGQETLQKKTRG